MNCPKCDKRMEHEEYDPSVGVMQGGWFCDARDVFIADGEVDNSDDLYA